VFGEKVLKRKKEKKGKEIPHTGEKGQHGVGTDHHLDDSRLKPAWDTP